jgi:hypothetical protein
MEFACCSTAYVNEATRAIRATICYAHDDRLTVTNVSNQHPRAKRQCSVRGCKPRWVGYLAACGASAMEGRPCRFQRERSRSLSTLTQWQMIISNKSSDKNGAWSSKFPPNTVTGDRATARPGRAASSSCCSSQGRRIARLNLGED